MTEIIGVRFKTIGKIYYFDAKGITVKKGQKVVVETSRGIECGEVALANKDVPKSEIVSPLKPIIRSATEADLKKIEENHKKEKEAFQICVEKIKKHELDMKLINVEYTFDNSKILFYFTSDGRVDFRSLVKDLAAVFRTRIELRQIGVRDESKQLGGLGICGRPFCCASFLGDFQPVSIKMAKEQGLSLNPTKISGTCGRLMCCLKYEQSAYDDLLKHSPKVGTQVQTPDGPGSIIDINLLSGKVAVKLSDNPDAAQRTFDKMEVVVIQAQEQKDDGKTRTRKPQQNNK